MVSHQTALLRAACSTREYVMLCEPSKRQRHREACLPWFENPQKASPRHSISLSARDRNDGGIVRLSALAVFRLMTRSNLVGCSTGMSTGFLPLRIMPTCSAARRHVLAKLAP